LFKGTHNKHRRLLVTTPTTAENGDKTNNGGKIQWGGTIGISAIFSVFAGVVSRKAPSYYLCKYQ